MTPFLYIAGVNDGPVKIGFANDPISRIRTIRTSSPVIVNLIHCFRVDRRCDAFEKTVHFVLDEKRLNGEWFDVSASVALNAIRNIADVSGVKLIREMPANAETINTGKTPARPKPGRPPSGKVRLTLLVDPAVIERYRATGPGWQARMADAIKAGMPPAK